MALSAEPFYFKLYATVLNIFRRTRPFHVLAKASSRINTYYQLVLILLLLLLLLILLLLLLFLLLLILLVHTINYSLIHFGGSTSMARLRIDIFGGPRNIPTTTAVRAEDKPISCFRFLAP
jgi:hypothetical protein